MKFIILILILAISLLIALPALADPNVALFLSEGRHDTKYVKRFTDLEYGNVCYVSYSGWNDVESSSISCLHIK